MSDTIKKIISLSDLRPDEKARFFCKLEFYKGQSFLDRGQACATVLEKLRKEHGESFHCTGSTVHMHPLDALGKIFWNDADLTRCLFMLIFYTKD